MTILKRMHSIRSELFDELGRTLVLTVPEDVKVCWLIFREHLTGLAGGNFGCDHAAATTAQQRCGE